MYSSKEFGGYLPIETNNHEYYNESAYPYLLRLNAARYGIVHAFKSGGFKRLLIPYYLCKTVVDSLARYQISYSFYSLNEQLEPIDVSLENGDAILIVNYYGIKDTNYLNQMAHTFQRVIIDNTQAFFSTPLLFPQVFNVYSPRKFVGVADGAYIVTSAPFNPIDITVETDYSASRSRHLFSAIEQGTNASYSDHLAAEEDLSSSPIRYMSSLTRHLLNSIDYQFIQDMHISNYRFLHEVFSKYNELRIASLPSRSSCIPMIYPLLIPNGESIRRSLVNNSIYVAHWWKWLLEDNTLCAKLTPFEKYLINNLVPLPIDQRYQSHDMEVLSNIILSLI